MSNLTPRLLGIVGRRFPVGIRIVSSSAVLWLRSLQTCCAPQFFQGSGVRLKESLPNIGIRFVPVAFLGPLLPPVVSNPIRRFPALSDLTSLTSFPLPG